MDSERQHRDEGAAGADAALKTRVAGILTASVIVSLTLAPEAFAGIAVNHNETVLALD